MASSQRPTIDTLLQAVPMRPEVVVAALENFPDLASGQDINGYSLLHAATSYGQLDLLRSLCTKYHCDPNITDTDGESPLFAAETMAAAQCLVEELGADVNLKNSQGTTAELNAAENIDDDDGGEWALVSNYLKLKSAVGGGQESSTNGDGVRVPPPLPPNVRLNIGTMPQTQLEGENAPDPEIRRRIEELAANPDFEGEESQAALRSLISDVVGNIADESNSRDVRRRT